MLFEFLNIRLNFIAPIEHQKAVLLLAVENTTFCVHEKKCEPAVKKLIFVFLLYFKIALI